MNDVDLDARNQTYAFFIEAGRAPVPEEIGSRPAVLASWGRLHDAHALVLNGERTELRMANPFSAVPTAYRVHARGRCWYGNCAWDAFGILAALHVDGRIETSCPDCGAGLDVEVKGTRPDDASLLFHCLVPAARWWVDIVFT
jgi:Alkylmercury lyase